MNFARAISKLLPETKPPEERKARTVPPNVGQGNSHFDSLWYYLARETYRALVRSLIEKELEDVSPLAVLGGHSHAESQAGAMDWWQVGVYTPCTSDGPANSKGPLVVSSTVETDYFFAPFVLPAGCSRIWPKVKVSNVSNGDRMNLHLRIFSPGSITPPFIDGGRLGITDYEGFRLTEDWMFFDAVDVSSLPTTADGVRLGLGLWSANVAAGGQVGYLWQTAYALRPGQ